MIEAFIFHAQQTAPAGQPQGPSFISFMPFILMFVGMYFFIIAPQRKKQKEHQKMIEGLKVGDNVMTNSGIYGAITSVKEDRFTIQIADNTKVDVNRQYVSSKADK